MAQADDRLHDSGIVSGAAQPLHECPVDLQCVHWEALQIAQRRVPRAKVVDGQLDAKCLETVQDRHRGIRVLHAVLSVISSWMHWGSTPLSRRARSTPVTRSGCWNW